MCVREQVDLQVLAVAQQVRDVCVREQAIKFEPPNIFSKKKKKMATQISINLVKKF